MMVGGVLRALDACSRRQVHGDVRPKSILVASTPQQILQLRNSMHAYVLWEIAAELYVRGEGCRSFRAPRVLAADLWGLSNTQMRNIATETMRGTCAFPIAWRVHMYTNAYPYKSRVQATHTPIT